MIGNDGNAATRALIPAECDLFERGVKIVAAMDDDIQRLVLLEFGREKIIDA